MKIFIDADACPKIIKEIIFRAARKGKIETYVVANHKIGIPPSNTIHQILVKNDIDEADNYIAQNVTEKDIVITSDIILADIIIEKGSIAIDPHGELYDESNIKERLAMRNLMAELRERGEFNQGGAPYSKKYKQKFAITFDRELHKKLRNERVL